MALSRLKAISSAWKAAIDSQEDYNNYRRELALGMFENGILTPEGVERGLSKARSNDNPFLPSVGEFVTWCQPTAEDYGLPSPEQAYIEAAHHRWGKHPIIYLAAKAVGVFEVATKPESQMRPKYVKAYRKLLVRVLAGEKFSDQRGGLKGIDQKMERLEVQGVTPEQAQDAKRQAFKLLGINR